MNNFFRDFTGREQDSCRVKTLLIKIIAVSSRKKKEDEWFHKYTRQTAHTLSAIQAVSHTQTHTSTHHNIQSKKEGWVLRGVGGLSLGIFFD